MNNATWREWWRAHSQDAWPVLVILIFFLTFFHPVFFGGKLFVINDAFLEYHPLRVAVFGELRHGRLPFWTPLIMSGYPLLSMSHIGVAYPLTWGYLGLPGYLAEQGFIIAPYLLTPLFIYAYVREIKLSRLAGLLAGLTFGYGGLMVSAVANNGLLPNAVMWLPLMLIAIDRARTRPFVRCLLGATAAYAMSVLTGVAQGFLYSGVLGLSYGAFLVFATDSFGIKAGKTRRWSEWRRWQPLLVAAGAVLLSAGVAAFQILETMRAARRSIRSVLSYELFIEGAYTLTQWFKAFLFPIHYINNATPCVPLIAIMLAVFAVIAATRDSRRDVRIFFWLAVAIASWVLMLGPNTPIYQGLHYIPFVNRFRAPARHAFEWTFAVAVLSAYGWNAAGAFLSHARDVLNQSEAKKKFYCLAMMLAALAVTILWRADFAKVPPLWDESNHYPNYPELRYLSWKILFALLSLSVVWWGWKIASQKWRVALQTGIIGLACFAEPSIMASRWWWPALKTPDRFTTPSPTTQFLQNYPAEQNRIYTRAALWTEEYQRQPRLDAGNLTMLYGLRNAGGYEPLILERYSRALGNVWMDSSSPLLGFRANTALFEPRSHVLDILNTTFVVGYDDLSLEPTPPFERDGIRFGAVDVWLELKPGETKELKGVARDSDTVALVTTLANSIVTPDGAIVARLRVFTSGGRFIEREIRAGRDTAEWAYERSDVRPIIRHKLAPVFDSLPGDESNSFVHHRYWTRIPLGESVPVERIEITNVSADASLAIWKVTLHDSLTGFSIPLPHYDMTRWESVYARDGVEIIRNQRALPRVWLVADVEAVDGEEALRRISGESEHPFDPKRTALLEVAPNELPRLPGGPISPDSSARLLEEEPNRLLIQTRSPTSAVLVISEVIYPGWVATVDGQATQIHTTNFILRGVAVPAGEHRVELRYTAPTARNGAFISLLTLIVIGGLAVRFARRHPRAPNHIDE
ncbi:MAG: YfhO family protein [Pyrinomonadaceae bacterium]